MSKSKEQKKKKKISENGAGMAAEVDRRQTSRQCSINMVRNETELNYESLCINFEEHCQHLQKYAIFPFDKI